MAREPLLKQSWDETRAFVAEHPRATAWSATALVLVLLAVTLGVSRGGGDPEAKTTVRADESAVSVSTPTTFFGNDLVGGGSGKTSKEPGRSTATTTGFTLRNGDGLHLYTGPVPTYGGGQSTATTTGGGGGGGTATTTPSNGGGGGQHLTPYPAAVFGPDRIAYVANDQLFTINPDGSDSQFVANSAYSPAWSPGHTALAVVEAPSPGGVLSYIAPNGGRYALTPPPDGTGEGDSRPTWSSDGLRIAFGRVDFQDSDGYSSIWVINKDGGHLQRLAVAGCFNADPAWSPDGTQIAFWSSRDHCSSGDNIGATELYLMNSNGTNVRRLGTAVNSQAPAFSPDGSKIAFASDRDGNFEIYVMNLDGSGQERLTTSSAEDTDPTWSPDGTRIAFRSARSGGGIYTMNPDGSDLRLVVRGGTQPSWS